MSKHTPGPWHVVDRHPAESRYGRHEFEVRTQGGAAITGWGSVTQTKANALLIAAAPDLLEALEAFSNDIVPNVHDDPLWVNARAAIAKAKGAALAESEGGL